MHLLFKKVRLADSLEKKFKKNFRNLMQGQLIRAAFLLFAAVGMHNIGRANSQSQECDEKSLSLAKSDELIPECTRNDDLLTCAVTNFDCSKWENIAKYLKANPDVKKIMLNKLKLVELPKLFVEGLNLVEIELEHFSHLSKIEKYFINTTTVERVKIISFPMLSSIHPEAYENLPNLIEVEIKDCPLIKTLEFSFRHLPQLEHLHVEGTSIITMAMPTLHTDDMVSKIRLYYNKNPLVCDCQTAWMKAKPWKESKVYCDVLTNAPEKAKKPIGEVEITAVDFCPSTPTDPPPDGNRSSCHILAWYLLLISNFAWKFSWVTYCAFN